MLHGRSRIRDVGGDNRMPRRDERFKDQAHRKATPDPLYDEAYSKKPAKCYRPVGSMINRTVVVLPRTSETLSGWKVVAT